MCVLGDRPTLVKIFTRSCIPILYLSDHCSANASRVPLSQHLYLLILLCSIYCWVLGCSSLCWGRHSQIPKWPLKLSFHRWETSPSVWVLLTVQAHVAAVPSWWTACRLGWSSWQISCVQYQYLLCLALLSLQQGWPVLGSGTGEQGWIDTASFPWAFLSAKTFRAANYHFSSRNFFFKKLFLFFFLQRECCWVLDWSKDSRNMLFYKTFILSQREKMLRPNVN